MGQPLVREAWLGWPYSADIPKQYGSFEHVPLDDEERVVAHVTTGPDGEQIALRCKRCSRSGGVLVRPVRRIVTGGDYERFAHKAAKLLAKGAARMVRAHEECEASEPWLPKEAKADLEALERLARARMARGRGPRGEFFYRIGSDTRIRRLDGPHLGDSPRGERYLVSVPAVARLREKSRRQGKPLRLVATVAESVASRCDADRLGDEFCRLPPDVEGRIECLVISLDYPSRSCVATYPIHRNSGRFGRGSAQLGDRKLIVRWHGSVAVYPFPQEEIVEFDRA